MKAKSTLRKVEGLSNPQLFDGSILKSRKAIGGYFCAENKKNRTGSEGGEKARYPSPVVGYNKFLSAMPNGVIFISGKLSSQLLKIIIAQSAGFGKRNFQKTRKFLHFF